MICASSVASSSGEGRDAVRGVVGLTWGTPLRPLWPRPVLPAYFMVVVFVSPREEAGLSFAVGGARVEKMVTETATQG